MASKSGIIEATVSLAERININSIPLKKIVFIDSSIATIALSSISSYAPPRWLSDNWDNHVFCKSNEQYEANKWSTILSDPSKESISVLTILATIAHTVTPHEAKFLFISDNPYFLSLKTPFSDFGRNVDVIISKDKKNIDIELIRYYTTKN